MTSTEVQQESVLCKVVGCRTAPAKGRKGLCLRHYQRERRTGSTDFPEKYDQCRAEGCSARPRSGIAEYCEAHYYQIRRNGYLGPKNRPPPLRTLDHTGGYKLLYAPKHSISTACQQSRVYEHRAVYYEHNGYGPFRCVHCGAAVTWQTMHVDHLDDDPANNDIDNLGASCPECNQARGRWKMKRTHRNRSPHQISWNGRTQHVNDWAEQLDIPPRVLKWRLARWSIERALTAPVGPTGPKRQAS